MEKVEKTEIDLQTRVIRGITLFWSLSLLLAGVCAGYLFDGIHGMHVGLKNIWVSPSPLVTDYFALGHLSSAFVNAGLCGLACFLIIHWLDAPCHTSTLAGFFLVIAHGFYGLNFVNMWPPFLSIFLFCKVFRIKMRDNLDIAMFATAFGPFFSELLFRYTLGRDFRIGTCVISIPGILLAIVMMLFLSIAIPAMLPGALKLHKGFNLYNGGLAFGLLGMVLYALMYKTMGIEPSYTLHVTNQVYEAANQSHRAFVNSYYLAVFFLLTLTGWWMNGRSFKGYRALMQDSGHRVDFFRRYSPALVLINMGIYGMFILAYFNAVIVVTKGDAFTGATTGIIIAALTFSASGQHPKNVWPIFAGYVILSAIVHLISMIYGREIPWTLSTQSYMNAAAFATGLCPLTGRYGIKVGMLAGFVSAIICTSTSSMHGGFVLYNGGLTAGITALILVPCIEYYLALLKIRE